MSLRTPLTPFFDKNVLPVRRGIYQTVKGIYRYFDGKYWYFGSTYSPYAAYKSYKHQCFRTPAEGWRGLAVNPKGEKTEDGAT